MTNSRQKPSLLRESFDGIMKMHDQAMARQRGVATLVVSVGVALLMAVAAVGMMRSGLLEQKIAANDLRAREAQEIAQAGLEFVMASNYMPTQECLKDNRGVLDLRDDKLGVFDGVLSAPNSQNHQTSKENYISSIKWCYSGGYYFARSEAKLNTETSVTKYFVEAWFQRGSLINIGIGIPPPFFINGNFCSSGNPSEKCNGGSILNSYGSITDLQDSPGVIATGSIKTDGLNSYQADSAKPNSNAFGGKSAWDYVFPGITLADAKIKAGQDPDNRWFYFNKNINNDDIYSNSDSPVVVIVGKQNNGDCYKINGGAVIYGIVYFADGCKANGWGGAKIYGSVVSDGDVDKLTANSEHYRFLESSWDKLKSNNPVGVFVIPGTWKDF